MNKFEDLIDFIHKTTQTNFASIQLEKEGMRLYITRELTQPKQLTTKEEPKEEVQEKKYTLIERIIANRVGLFKLKEEITTGKRVTKGEILGYIKCINLTFDIKAPCNGEILEIKVPATETPVEYGQELIVINSLLEESKQETNV